jgi:hypothetical protein
MGEKGDRVPMGVIELTEDIRDGETGGICVETNQEIRIEVTKDGSGGKTVFKFHEGFLSLGGLFKLLIFMKKRRDRGSNIGVFLNKVTIEICETQKDLDIMGRDEDRPFSDHSNSILLHRDAIRRDDETKE